MGKGEMLCAIKRRVFKSICTPNNNKHVEKLAVSPSADICDLYVHRQDCTSGVFNKLNICWWGLVILPDSYL